MMHFTFKVRWRGANFNKVYLRDLYLSIPILNNFVYIVLSVNLLILNVNVSDKLKDLVFLYGLRKSAYFL